MGEVHADPCVTVELDSESGVLYYVRTEVPYRSNADFVAMHVEIGRALDRIGRDGHTLLVDMRRATMNNDPAFERAAERARVFLLRGFSRVAVLVNTAVGSLQVKRHVREDGRDIGVFSNEQEALDYLAGKIELPAKSDEDMPRSGVGVAGEGAFRHIRRRAAKR